MERLNLTLSKFYVTVMAIGGVMTCGVAAAIMWFIARQNFPRTIDFEGITIRNGQRLYWRDLTRKQRVTVFNQSGGRMTGRLELFFGKKRVSIAPQSFAEGAQLLPFLSRVLGEDVQVG